MRDRTIVVLVTAGLLLACEPDVRLNKFCQPGGKVSQHRAKFIVDCAKAANPMSDEEGEDLVRQCAIEAGAIFPSDNCAPRLEVKKGDCGNCWIPCDQAAFESRQQAACERFGWQRIGAGGAP